MAALQLGIWSGIFQLLYFLLIVAATVLLLQWYLRTRASGILWLLAAVVLIPVLARLATMLLPFALAAHAYPVETVALFNIVFFGFVGVLEGGLLLVASLLLSRQLTANSGRLY